MQPVDMPIVALLSGRRPNATGEAGRKHPGSSATHIRCAAVN